MIPLIQLYFILFSLQFRETELNIANIIKLFFLQVLTDNIEQLFVVTYRLFILMSFVHNKWRLYLVVILNCDDYSV
jgi:hypothetical protein